MKSTTSSILFALLFAFATLVPLSMQAAVFGNETTGTSTYPGAGFERLTSVATGTSNDIIYPIGVDPSGDYAYFSIDDGTLNRVAKVDLSDLSIVDALPLESDENNSYGSGGAIDPAGDFAYVLTSESGNESVIKIDLSDFSRADDYLLPIVGSNHPYAAVIDPTGDYLYVSVGGTVTNNLGARQIIRVNLATFATSTSIDLAATFPDGATFAGGAAGAAITSDGSFAYFSGGGATSSNIYKIDLSTFTPVDSLEVLSGVNPGQIMPTLIDPEDDFLYAGTKSVIVKVDLSDFSLVGTVQPNNSGDIGEHQVGAMDPNGRFAYFAGGTYPIQVAQIDLADFSHSDTVVLPSGEDDTYGAVMDPLGENWYIGTLDWSNPPQIVKVALPSLPATFPQGYVLASEVTLTEEADIESISLHSHTATGTVRLALYNSTLDLVWESGAVTNDATDDVVTALISAGTPTTLTGLAAGTYYLAFQIEGSDAVPSFTEGESGEGLRLTQSYAAFPADLDAATDTTQTWTIYATYSVPVEEVVEEEEEEESSGSTSSHRRSGGGGGSSSDDDDDSSGSSSAEIETLMQQLLDLLTVYLELLMKQRGM